MGTPQRILVGIASALVVLIVAAGVAAGIYAKHAGMLVLDVAESEGCNVHLRLPVAALELASWFVPSGVTDHLGPWWPAVEPLLDQLGSLPGFVLVDVNSSDERVRIETRKGLLIVRALSPSDRVELSVPIRAAARILQRLGRASGACSSATARGAWVAI